MDVTRNKKKRRDVVRFKYKLIVIVDRGNRGIRRLSVLGKLFTHPFDTAVTTENYLSVHSLGNFNVI